jgi:hypothetical protein
VRKLAYGSVEFTGSSGGANPISSCGRCKDAKLAKGRTGLEDAKPVLEGEYVKQKTKD